jgi:hypothetical protein
MSKPVFFGRLSWRWQMLATASASRRQRRADCTGSPRRTSAAPASAASLDDRIQDAKADVIRTAT